MARYQARPDVYQRVTNQIVAQLEAGVQPWHQPWAAGGTASRPQRHNGVPYRGINTVLLWASSCEQGFSSPFWMTYKQSQELSAQVRKGERSTQVVYAGAIEKTGEDGNGDETQERIPFLKAYNVFNAEQIDGLPESYYAKPVVPDPKERIAHVDAFIAATGANIRVGGTRAFYDIANDYIGMPDFALFESAESHAIVTCHELAHWTRHPTRLDRDLGRKRWGDEGYAREELVALLSQAFLAADLSLENEPREDHAAYAESWIRVLKNDKRAIFQAAAHAERAVAYLHSLQPREDEASDQLDEAA